MQEHQITIEDIRHEAALLEFNVEINDDCLDIYHRSDQTTGFWSIAPYNDPLVLVGAWQFLQERRAYLDQLGAARRDLANRLAQCPRKRSWLTRCSAKRHKA